MQSIKKRSHISPRCFLQLEPKKEKYDIYSEGRILFNGVFEEELENNYPTIACCINPKSPISIEVSNIHYYRDAVYGRNIDPYTPSMWLRDYQNMTQVMHIPPIWEDSKFDHVRVSEMQYNLIENMIVLFPLPQSRIRIYFEISLTKEGVQ